MRGLAGGLLVGVVCAVGARGQAVFAVASIRPSAGQVRFEGDGETKLRLGSVEMRDVTVEKCILWAYGVQRGQVLGPGLLRSERYDVVAKADGTANEDEMKLMMRALLMERFHLAFHREKKELKSFGLVVAKSGAKMKPATPGEVPYRRNSAMGSVAQALTMQEFADFLSEAVEKPVVDKTEILGRWDFSFDFTKYVTDQPKGIDDYLQVLNPTLEGDVGVKMVPEKDVVEVLVVDRVEKASAN